MGTRSSTAQADAREVCRMSLPSIPDIVRDLCAEDLSPTDAIALLNQHLAAARDVRPYRCTFAAAALQEAMRDAVGTIPQIENAAITARRYSDALIAELEANPYGA